MRFVLPALVFAALVGVFFLGLGRDPSVVRSPLIGRAAPVFELPSLHDADEVVRTEDLLGQVALFNVWATWCVGCRQEHETLIAISKSGIVPIYSLNWKDQRPAALEWLQRLGNPYTATAFDPDGSVAIDWGVYGAPETFVIDATGKVVYKHVGPIDERLWRDQLLPVVMAAKEQRS